ncbi:MAG: PQQ-binding-like beta-propeller repeat protein, partial [candidate division KSB1 bacterium]|nr:PQQ-binding-like beta-propeller repeat protein [candidate division KSB1 bacterium]
FDQDNDNRWDPSGMVTEGAIAFNSSAVAYSSYGGDYPETFTMAAASVPTGVAGVLSAASGHVQYELSLDLTTSPLTAGPGETIGAFIWVDDPGAFYPYHVGNAGEWPAGALWDAATSLGNLTLAREPGPVVTNFDWPMVNGGPLRWSWAVGETQLYPPFGYTADFSIGSATAAYPVYFDNTLYASLDGFPNRLIAYDVKSQTELWHFDIPYSDGDCLCTPAVNDCTVFIGGQLGRGLYALNRWTGEQKWLKEIGSLFRHHPIVDETFVYVLCHDSLYCLRADHGRTVWSYPAAVATNSSYTPLVDGQQVYAVINGELWAFEKQTGAPRWHVPNDYGSLVADADLIYSIHGNQVMARTKTTGTLFWAYTFPDALIEHVGSVLALSDDALCFALERNNSNSKAELYVLDKATGAYRWHYTFSGRGNFFPTIANDIVYGVLGAYGENGDGSLWGFDINTGGVVFYDHSVRYARQPIVAGHTLFVPSAGVIKAFGNQPVTVRQTDSTVQPQRFALAQNYPNPFNPETVISYVLPTAVDVKLTICNPLGQVIAALVDERQVAGNYRITWNGLDQTGAPASSGLYFCILRCGDQIQSRKILLLK